MGKVGFLYLCGMAKKDTKVRSKAVHVTLHKISSDDKKYWIEKGMSFRSNTSACLVGIESNHTEEKDLHAHIVLQFTTSQDMDRKMFVKHFGTDSLHVTAKTSKNALLIALGYVSKTGNIQQIGDFVYRGVPIDSNPEVYKFNYQVANIDDGLRYFHKVLRKIWTMTRT